MAARLPPYRYGGARAMVELHDQHLRGFLASWRELRRAGIPLPPSDDPSYASHEALLAHVLGCARSYLRWMCEVLELPEPVIEPVPALDRIETEAERYLEHVIDAWRTPLAGVTEEQAYRPEHPSRWETRYCIDAMLEHAVMHPIRHRHQIVGWLGAAGRG